MTTQTIKMLTESELESLAEALNLLHVAQSLVKSAMTSQEPDDHLDSALWRAVDAAGILRTIRPLSMGTGTEPTGRGFLVSKVA